MGRDTAMGTERDGCKTRVGVHLVTLVMQLPTLEWAGAYINGWGRREMETGVNDERVLSRRSAQPLFDTRCCTTRTLFHPRIQVPQFFVWSLQYILLWHTFCAEFLQEIYNFTQLIAEVCERHVW